MWPLCVTRPMIRTAILAVVLLLAGNAVFAAGKQGLVLQVSDDDPKIWNQTLNNAMNVSKEFGKNVDIEIVAFGPGLKMLRLDSEVSERLTEASKAGIALVACSQTMKKTKIAKKDLHPSARVVKVGVVEILARQKQGWAYVKP